eukprot:CAMPEP_0119010224 /NCGR_PEP_ID=MMETSP1176-20130426/4873_1 /TAXON_ID=265551 /ORGANISM="Synedropsis recta cf, Strain CCMP1620" /LENGTH=586 /DNA_ID=CAMNT_0006962851 /DNA_START=90 /DNA_END=1847 /DNA_ORIENTATION=+
MKILSILYSAFLVGTASVEAGSNNGSNNLLRGQNQGPTSIGTTIDNNRGTTQSNSKRDLQSDPMDLPLPPNDPAKRSCGDIINIATVDQIKQVAAAVVGVVLGSNPAAAAVALPTVQGILKYDVQAQVVCGTCDEVREMYDGANFMSSEGPSDFDSYCGEGKFAADKTFSSLLLIPYDGETGKPIQGTLKPHLYMKSFSGRDQQAPTEFWTDDFDQWNSTDPVILQGLIGVFYDGWAPLFIASTGTVVMAPDYLGYGQSYLEPKLNGIKAIYQQSTAIAFLKSKKIVESTGCTLLEKDMSASGYSEGGAAVVIGANALLELGQDILNVDSGGAPFDSSFQIALAIKAIDSGNFLLSVRDFAVSAAASISSKSSDLANSNVGQNFLNDVWVDRLNEVTNRNIIFQTTLGPYLPDPATDVFNAGWLEHTRSTLATNVTDSCITTTPGVDDLLCQAIIENEAIGLAAGTRFPLSICHSPDDDIVGFPNAPDLSSNTNLYEMKVFGVGASGGHFDGLVFCQLGYVLQFSAFGSAPNVLTGVGPLPDPNACGVAETVAPVSLAPNPAPLTHAPVAALVGKSSKKGNKKAAK